MNKTSGKPPASLVDAAVWENQDTLAADYASQSPFRHVVIPEFLNSDLCQGLLKDFPDFEARHALNEMGQVGGKAVRMDVTSISEHYRALDTYIQSDEFLELVSRITGIPDLLYDPDYIGGGTHENRDGQSLDVHVDFNYHPRTRWHRRLNLIIYLNPEWEPDWGGQLELHSDPWNTADDRSISVGPDFNRCVIFETTECSWHGFSTIRLPETAKHLSRKSFAIYLYTRERPGEQTAAPHATVYVPEALPAAWQAGRVLSEPDIGELRQRFTRLRTQLRYLYERELRFGAQIASLEQALEAMRSAVRLEIQGYATQPRGAQGFWPDGWAASQLEAVFVASRPVSGLLIELWSPPQIQSKQEVRISLGERIHTQSFRPGVLTLIELPWSVAANVEIPLKIEAQYSWTPSSDGTSSDQRSLSYRIVRIALRQ